MDYLTFDLLALALPAALLLTHLSADRAYDARRLLLPVATLAALALLWTAPWDTHLIATGVWTYSTGAVRARLGLVPVEEYLFVVLEVVLVAAWSLHGRGPHTRLVRTHERSQPPPDACPAGSFRPVTTGSPAGDRWRGGLAWAGLAGAGLVLEGAGGHLRYLGLILLWAGPPLAVQHVVAGDVLRSCRQARLRVALPVALWLSTADRLALAGHIWTISPGSATGLGVLGLPVEEAAFFGLTCLLVADGLLLARDPRTLARVARLLPHHGPLRPAVLPRPGR